MSGCAASASRNAAQIRSTWGNPFEGTRTTLALPANIPATNE